MSLNTINTLQNVFGYHKYPNDSAVPYCVGSQAFKSSAVTWYTKTYKASNTDYFYLKSAGSA